jgi:DNA-binding transcriptional LysR family regulator
MLDLNEVQMFLETVRAGSFAEAARRLAIPSNTLSRRVRALEEHLETRLIQRSTRKLSLTSAGQLLFEGSASALELVVRAAQDLTEGRAIPKGSVRVAAPAGFFDLCRMEWIAEFLAQHPRVRVEFSLHDERSDLVAEGIDVAFRAVPPDGKSHVYRTILANPSSLCASPAYLAAHEAPRTLSQLAAHDCVTLSNRTGRTVWRLKGPGGAEEVEITGRFGANDTRALLRACVCGLGIALLPHVLSVSEVRAGRLAAVLPEYIREAGAFQIVMPSPEQIPAAVLALADFIEQRLRDALTDEPPLVRAAPTPLQAGSVSR